MKVDVHENKHDDDERCKHDEITRQDKDNLSEENCSLKTHISLTYEH